TKNLTWRNEMSEVAEDDLFGFDSFVEDEEEVEAPQRRQRKPYREATIRPPSKLEASASMESIFAEDDFWEKTPLQDLYVTQKEVLQLKGSNGLKVIGTFDGGGGSLTGFAWSGWQDLMSVEFVEAARETLAANYPSFMVTPHEVKEAAEKVAAEMDLEVGVAKFKNGDLYVTPDTAKVVVTPEMKSKKRIIASSINWEETLTRIGGILSNEFRHRVTEAALEGRPRDHEI